MTVPPFPAAATALRIPTVSSPPFPAVKPPWIAWTVAAFEDAARLSTRRARPAYEAVLNIDFELVTDVRGQAAAEARSNEKARVRGVSSAGLDQRCWWFKTVTGTRREWYILTAMPDMSATNKKTLREVVSLAQSLSRDVRKTVDKLRPHTSHSSEKSPPLRPADDPNTEIEMLDASLTDIHVILKKLNELVDEVVRKAES